MNLQQPTRPEDALPDRLVGQLIRPVSPRSFHTHSCRGPEGLQAVPERLPNIRVLLRDALIDPNPSIRYEGLAAITPQATTGMPKLTYEQARQTLVSALEKSDPAVRLGAVQALNVFGAAAAPQIPVLEGLAKSDPDSRGTRIGGTGDRSYPSRAPAPGHLTVPQYGRPSRRQSSSWARHRPRRSAPLRPRACARGLRALTAPARSSSVGNYVMADALADRDRARRA